MSGAAVVYRFARDLRLDDHAALSLASSLGSVLPVLVIDRALETSLCASSRRAQFYCAAVAALDEALRERGSRLIVRRGNHGAVIKQLARATGARTVVWGCAYDHEAMQRDQRLQSELEEVGLSARIVHDAPAIAPDDTASARGRDGVGYRAFAPYFEVWATRPVPPAADGALRLLSTDLQSEALPQPADFGSPLNAAGVNVRPHRKLDRFLDSAALQYSVAINVPSDEGTSHLSADLSFGTIAARTVARRVLQRLDDPFILAEERASLRLFLRALAMRDFFLQLAWFHPDADREPLQEKMHAFAFAKKHPSLDAWLGGRTGFPLVDAGIRQLHETGWMHPHVRAVAASFLCFDLGVDWRVGRDEWERWLIEDDRALSSGNWQWIAGIGADMAQYPRIYNPERQRRRFDPDGTYVARWVGELAGVPVGAWRDAAAAQPQLRFDLFNAEAYPQPVVDHEAAARAFLARYRAHLSA